MRQCFINQVPSYLSHVFTEKFDEIDTDKSGDISREELKASMSKDTPDEDIDFLLNVCDESIEHTRLNSADFGLTCTFLSQLFDVDGGGTISLQEFIAVASLNDRLTGKRYRTRHHYFFHLSHLC